MGMIRLTLLLITATPKLPFYFIYYSEFDGKYVTGRMQRFRLHKEF